MKLGAKLTIFIAISSLITISFISFLSYYLTKKATQDIIATQQLELARQTMDKIDRLLYERYNGIRSIAGNISLVQYLLPIQNAKTETEVSVPPLVTKTLEELSLT